MQSLAINYRVGMSYVLVLYPGISAQRWKKCKAANTNPF